MASKGFHCHLLLMDAQDRKKELSEGTLPGYRLHPHFTITGGFLTVCTAPCCLRTELTN